MSNITSILQFQASKQYYLFYFYRVVPVFLSFASQPLVLIMVTVPLPWVWILVRATTALPERPGPSPETNGWQANFPTGCRTGRVGRMRILLLMSLSVTSPSSPPGFTTANGYATLFPVIIFLLLHRLSEHQSPKEEKRITSQKRYTNNNNYKSEAALDIYN